MQAAKGKRKRTVTKKKPKKVKQATPKKNGRKNIRKIRNVEELNALALAARKAEEERQRRLQSRKVIRLPSGASSSSSSEDESEDENQAASSPIVEAGRIESSPERSRIRSRSRSLSSADSKSAPTDASSTRSRSASGSESSGSESSSERSSSDSDASAAATSDASDVESDLSFEYDPEAYETPEEDESDELAEEDTRSRWSTLYMPLADSEEDSDSDSSSDSEDARLAKAVSARLSGTLSSRASRAVTRAARRDETHVFSKSAVATAATAAAAAAGAAPATEKPAVVRDVYSDAPRIVINTNREKGEREIAMEPEMSSFAKEHQVHNFWCWLSFVCCLQANSNDNYLLFQIRGIRFLWDNTVESIARVSKEPGFGCILAHEMGLGKTFQVLFLLDVLFVIAKPVSRRAAACSSLPSHAPCSPIHRCGAY